MHAVDDEFIIERYRTLIYTFLLILSCVLMQFVYFMEFVGHFTMQNKMYYFRIERSILGLYMFLGRSWVVSSEALHFFPLVQCRHV